MALAISTFILLPFLVMFLFTSCESATQTAIRQNQPPAIAYVVAANKGEPLPTAIIIREND